MNRIGLPGVLSLLVVLVLLVPLTAAAQTASVGWTRSDVGLNDKGDGLYLGITNNVTWDNPVFDVVYGLEYVQKKGSQPTPFSDPVGGFTVADAEVTLHVLEPAVFVGARVPGLSFVPRVYVGSSIGLKVKESWSDFPGVPDVQYGYKDTDFILHVGVSAGVGPFTVDARWSRSMVGQLLIDPNPVPLKSTDKATDPMSGVLVPEEGFDTQVVRLGLAYSF